MVRVRKSPKLPLSVYTNSKRGKHGHAVVDAEGGLWWRETDDDRWQRAAFHWAVRSALIREAATRGTYQTWTDGKGRIHSRGDSVGPDDVTAYHPGQDWTLERDNRPPKTFQFIRTLETEPTYPVETWIWHGLIMLDYDGYPMRAFQALPATISSKEDGCFLEGMFREDPRIMWDDIIARVPWKEVPRAAPSPSETPSLYEPIIDFHAMSMRCARFRNQAACTSWKRRGGSDKLREVMESYLPPDCVASNSTRGFRDFTDVEVAEINKAGKGTKPERARKNALFEADRRSRQEAKMARREADADGGRPTNVTPSEPRETDDSMDSVEDARPHRFFVSAGHRDSQAVPRSNDANKETSDNEVSNRLPRPLTQPSRKSIKASLHQRSKRAPWKTNTKILHQPSKLRPWRSDTGGLLKTPPWRNSPRQSFNHPPRKPSVVRKEPQIETGYIDFDLEDPGVGNLTGHASATTSQRPGPYFPPPGALPIDPCLANYPPLNPYEHLTTDFAYPPLSPTQQPFTTTSAFQTHCSRPRASLNLPTWPEETAIPTLPPFPSETFSPDYRHIPPLTPSEHQTVGFAIELTRNRLQDLLLRLNLPPQPAPHISYGQTYADAYRTLNEVLRAAWVADGREGRGEDVPTLPCILGWVDGFPRIEMGREDGGCVFEE